MASLKRVLAVAALLAAVGALVGWTSFAGTTPSGTGPATIRIVDRQFSYTRVDVGRRGRSPGDYEVIATLLYNKKITQKPIGSGRMICTFTIGLNRTCITTIKLPRGQLVASGGLVYRQFYSLAVIGGTGLYDNARGTMTVIRTTRSPTREIMVFRLTG